MNNENFQTFFDCGFSKIRAGTFNRNNNKEAFYVESEFFIDESNLESNIQRIVTCLEKDSNEYIDNISLMIDSPKMLSVGISLSKKLDGSKLKEANIQFLVQEAKQQILKYYTNHNIAHIIINNYKINGIDYSYLPNEIKCDFISLDILFICLPTDLVLYFKDIFSKSNILVNQIICSSYAKSINYKNNINLSGYTSFIDIGFKKTSVISYYNDKIISLNVSPIGSNHITQDISKILKIDMESSEQMKLNFNQNFKPFNNEDIPVETLKKIIFCRTEEILELCAKSIELDSSSSLGKPKILMIGEGSKIFNNKYKDKISFSDDIDFIEETSKDICLSGFKLIKRLNKQEVVVVPKKQIKDGFFEKFFHFFR
jgi:cell division protein FtsA